MLNKPSYIPESTISKKAQEVLDMFMCLQKNENPPYIIKNIIWDVFYEKEGLAIDDEPMGEIRLVPEQVLGCIVPSERKIKVTAGLQDKSFGLFQFTLAHELGHWILHCDEFRKDKNSNHNIQEQEKQFVTINRDLSDRINNPVEIQANIFAANLLMPKEEVIRFFQISFGNKSITVNDNLRLYSKDYASRNHLGQKALNKRFAVSKEAMAIRLEHLGLVQLRNQK